MANELIRMTATEAVARLRKREISPLELIDAAEASDSDGQDAADAARMYEILEREIVPAFYERENGIPRDWLRVVRSAIATVAARFSARRMVKEYVDTMYAPALKKLVNS